MLVEYALTPNIEILSLPGPHSPGAGCEREADIVWVAERARRGDALHDGLIFSVSSISPDRITGRFVPYRWLVAQRRRPDLASQLRIRPLAVSGLLRCRDGVVFGARSWESEQDPGCWELVPSGGVGPVTNRPGATLAPECQVIEELAEEVGLEPAQVAVSGPVCLLEDTASGVLDLGFVLTTELGEADILRAHAGTTREYDRLEIVADAALADVVARLGDRLVPVSRWLLRSAMRV
jgi:hypothetical protein